MPALRKQEPGAEGGGVLRRDFQEKRVKKDESAVPYTCETADPSPLKRFRNDQGGGRSWRRCLRLGIPIEVRDLRAVRLPSQHRLPGRPSFVEARNTSRV